MIYIRSTGTPFLCSVAFPYNPKLVDIMRTLQGATWNKADKVWLMDEWWVPELKTRAEGLLHQVIDKRAHPCEPLRISDTDTTAMWPHLWPYQKSDAQILAAARHNFCLNYSMRVGKTPTTLAAARLIDPQAPVLTVCPALARPVWRAAIEQWWPERESDVVHVKDGAKSLAAACNEIARNSIVIVSYQLLAKFLRALSAPNVWAPQFIIADECHLITNSETKVAGALSEAGARFSTARRWGLTGTMFANNPTKVHGILSWLAPGVFGHFHNFRARYANPTPSKFAGCGYTYSGSNQEHATELAQRIARFSIRRTRLDPEVALYFPKASATAIKVPAGGPAFDPKEWAEGQFAEGSTHLVFLYYNVENCKKAAEQFTDMAPVACITGSATPERRSAAIAELRALPKGIVCATIDSTWGAIDLSFCTTPLYMEMGNKLIHMIQSFDRFVKCSGTRPVIVTCVVRPDQERQFVKLSKALESINTLQKKGEAEAGLSTVLSSVTQIGDAEAQALLSQLGISVNEGGW